MPEQGKERGHLSRKDQKNPLKKGKSYLLGIGIDTYLEAFPNDLNNAVKDLQDFIQVLSDKYELDKVITVLNEEATRDNIIEQFDALVDTLKEEDKLIVYYSGHGHLNRLKRGFWIPHDAKKGNTSRYIRNSRYSRLHQRFSLLTYLINLRFLLFWSIICSYCSLWLSRISTGVRKAFFSLGLLLPVDMMNWFLMENQARIAPLQLL